MIKVVDDEITDVLSRIETRILQRQQSGALTKEEIHDIQIRTPALIKFLNEIIGEITEIVELYIIHVRALEKKSPVKEEALHRFQPSVALGLFVPSDSGVDEAVLRCPSVKHYVVLNARIGGALRSPALWQASGWKALPLGAVQPWMLTRHDVWMGPDHPILQHGEAWLFKRVDTPTSKT